MSETYSDMFDDATYYGLEPWSAAQRRYIDRALAQAVRNMARQSLVDARRDRAVGIVYLIAAGVLIALALVGAVAL